MLDGMALFWVKPGEVRRSCHADEVESPISPASTHLGFLQISDPAQTTFAFSPRADPGARQGPTFR